MIDRCRIAIRLGVSPHLTGNNPALNFQLARKLTDPPATTLKNAEQRESDMKRRTFLAASTVSLAAPSLVRAQSQTKLKFIPATDLAFLDPHWTPACVHGYMVFDTLYGQNGSFAVSPQMVAGHITESDGKLWKLTLREGLLWHDGTPVLARDCAASIKRWAKRDPYGDALIQATDELSAPDDRTIQFHLSRPFALLPDALGKVGPPMPAMMQAAGQYRSVQADHRNHRQRPLSLPRR
jgi:ABC-type transport system substrate-binding protein